MFQDIEGRFSGKWDPTPIDLLVNCSLVKQSAGNSAISIHPLIAEVVRDSLQVI